MRAAVIVNPAKADVPALREQVDKTLATAGWSLERFRGRSVLVEADRIVPRQMDGEVIDDGRKSQRADRARPSGRPRAAAGGDGRLTE